MNSNQEIILKFNNFLVSSGVSINSLKYYRSDLQHFLNYTNNLESIKEETIRGYLRSFPHTTPISSINRKLSTLRGFSKFLIEKEIVKHDFMHGISNLTPGTLPSKYIQPKIQSFDKYLIDQKVSKNTRKNYLSDVNKFLAWQKKTEGGIKQYLNSLYMELSRSSHDRTIASLKKYYEFKKQEFPISTLPIPKNAVYSNWQRKILTKLNQNLLIQTILHNIFFNRPKWYKIYHSYPIASYIHFAVLVIFSALAGYLIYSRLFAQAYPTSPVVPNRYLSFQGRLTNPSGTPITTATNHVFKLYDVDIGGTELWDSGTCSITPGANGIFSTLLGSDCGGAIPSSVFTENAAIWLGVTVGADAEATPRIAVATVAYALNSETIQGFPLGTGTSTVPYIDSTGKLAIAAASPTIESTSGTFGLSSQAMTISTADTTNGSISIAPDGTGALNLTFEGAAVGSGNGFINANNANITSGALYGGTVASNATGYNFIDFQSGSSPTSVFSVNNAGNITSAGDLLISGGNINTGNTSLVVGDATTDTIQLLTDGTGNGEILLPNNSIGPNEIASTGQTDEYCLTFETGGTWEWQTCGGGDTLWSDGTGYIYPTGAEVLGNPASAGANKLAGIYLEDSAPLYLGTDNDTNFSFSGSTLSLALGVNSLTIDNKVGIGTASPTSLLHVSKTSANSLGKSAFIVDQYEDQDILTASASGTTKLVLQNDGTLSLRDATSTISNGSGNITFDSASGIFDFSGDNITNGGNLELDGVIQVGGGSALAYNRFGTSTTGHAGAISTSSDMLAMDAEFDGNIYLDGGIIANSAGTSTVVFSSTPTTTANTLSAGNWLIDNTANVGLAALTVNQQKAGHLFTASASGSPRVTINNAGDLTIGFSGTSIPTTTNPLMIYGHNTTNVASVDTSGNATFAGDLTITGGNITSAITFDNGLTSAGNVTLSGTSANILLGSNFLSADGGDEGISVDSTGNVTASGDLTISGGNITNLTTFDNGLTSTGTLTANGTLNANGAVNLGDGGDAVEISGSSLILDIAGTNEVTLSASSLFPSTSNGNALGSATNMWADLFLASGGVIDFNGDMTITHAADSLTVAGGGLITSGALTANGALNANGAVNLGDGGDAVEISGSSLILDIAGTNEVTLTASALSPSTSDSNALGTSSLMWSDLFLASGSVVNFNNGDVTLTHAAGALTIAGGSLTTAALTAGGTLTANGAFTLGDNGDTGAVNTSDWDISTAGVMTGIGAITADGNFTLSGSAANVLLGSNFLSGDGGDEGISVSAAGDVTASGDFLANQVGLNSAVEAGSQIFVNAAVTRSARFHKSTIGAGSSTFIVSTDEVGSTDIFLSAVSDWDSTLDTEFRVNTDGSAFADGGWNGAADFAEYFNSTDTTIEKGELVALSTTEKGKIVRASQSSGNLLGVVSTNPGFIGTPGTNVDEDSDKYRDDPTWKIVGLMGQVPTLVSNENGAIKPGDPLTISTTPGVAMKATGKGYIVGNAMETYNNSAPGKISAYISRNWYDPSLALNSSGEITIEGKRYKDMGDLASNNLFAQTSKLVTSFISSLRADRAKIDRIETNTISPVGDADLIVDLQPDNDVDPSEFAIKGNNDKVVASIDASGNAEFEGNLRSQTLEVEDSATVSGTLYANDIQSSKLSEIEKLLRDVESNNSLLAASETWNTNTATESATFKELYIAETLATSNLFVSESLTTDNLNSLDSPLKIQSLALAPLEIMAGRIAIDIQGNTKFLGNVEIAGNLTIKNLIISNDSPVATSSATTVESGTADSNAVAGKAKITKDTNEIKITNPNVRNNSLIYVTPTGSTQNKVLYVKSKEEGKFTAGFDETIPFDVEFNWWIIELEATNE